MRSRNGTRNRIKKNTYFFTIFFIGFLVIVCYHLFSPNHIVTRDHATLPLTPFTAREQKDLIRSQEQEEQLDVGGPLVSQMSPTEAQARVLNLNHNSKQSNHS